MSFDVMYELPVEEDRYHYPTRHGVLTFENKRGLSKKQKSFLELARKMALSSDCTERHGAVIVKSGRVLSLGHNKWRNESLIDHGMIEVSSEERKPITVHAEIDALSRIQDPEGTTIYIARISKDGEDKLSQPCPSCSYALNKAGVKRVVFTL